MKKEWGEVTNRLENAGFFQDIRRAVAEKLDDLATDPKLKNGDIPLDLGEKIRKGEKVPASVVVRDAIISVGQDFRLMPDEIDIILERFLE
ncbi:MAG: hypothetical protein AAB797_00960 [Patescibacteria group bacterium]